MEMSALRLYKVLCDQVLSLSNHEGEIILAPLIEILSKLHNLLVCGACGCLARDPYRKSSEDCSHNVCKSCIGLLITSCGSCRPEGGCYKSNVELQLLLNCYTNMCKLIWASSFFRKILITNYANNKLFIDKVAEGADFPERSSNAKSFSADENSSLHPIEPSSSDYIEILMDNLFVLATMTEVVNYESFIEIPPRISDPEVFIKNPESSNLQQSSCDENKNESSSTSRKLRKRPYKRKQCSPSTRALKQRALEKNDSDISSVENVSNGQLPFKVKENSTVVDALESRCSSPEVILNTREIRKLTSCTCNSNIGLKSPLTSCIDISCPCYINKRACSFDCACCKCKNPKKLIDEINNILEKRTVNNKTVKFNHSKTVVQVKVCNKKNSMQINRSGTDRSVNPCSSGSPSFLNHSSQIKTSVLSPRDPLNKSTYPVNPCSSGSLSFLNHSSQIKTSVLSHRDPFNKNTYTVNSCSSGSPSILNHSSQIKTSVLSHRDPLNKNTYTVNSCSSGSPSILNHSSRIKASMLSHNPLNKSTYPVNTCSNGSPSFLNHSSQIKALVLSHMLTYSGNKGRTAGKEATENNARFNLPSCSFQTQHMDVGDSSSTLTMNKNEIRRPNYSLHSRVHSRTVVKSHSPQVNLSDSKNGSKTCTSKELMLSRDNLTCRNPPNTATAVNAIPSSSGSTTSTQIVSKSNHFYRPPLLNPTESPDNPELFDFSLENIMKYLYARGPYARGPGEKPGFNPTVSCDGDSPPTMKPNAALMSRVEELNMKANALALANPALLAYYIARNSPKKFACDTVITID